MCARAYVRKRNKTGLVFGPDVATKAASLVWLVCLLFPVAAIGGPSDSASTTTATASAATGVVSTPVVSLPQGKTVSELRASYDEAKNKALAQRGENERLRSDFQRLESKRIGFHLLSEVLLPGNWGVPFGDALSRAISFRYRLFFVLLGFLCFVLLKRHAVGYLLSRESLERTLWWRREPSGAKEASVLATTILAILLAVLLSLTLFRPALKGTLPFSPALPEFQAPRSISLETNEVRQGKPRTVSESGLQLDMPQNARQAYDMASNLNRKQPATIRVQGLDKRQYPELPLPSTLSANSPLYWYLMGVLSAECGLKDNTQQYLGRFLEEAGGEAEGGLPVEWRPYTRATLSFFYDQGGASLLSRMLPARSYWVGQAEHYLNLMEMERYRQDAKAREPILTIALSNCSRNMRELERLITGYFKDFSLDAKDQQDFLVILAESHRNDPRILVTCARVCYQIQPNDLSSNVYLQQAASLCTNAGDLLWLGDVAQKMGKINIASVALVKMQGALGQITPENLATGYSLEDTSLLDLKGASGRDLSLGLLLAAIHFKAKHAQGGLDLLRQTLCLDYCPASEIMSLRTARDLEDRVQRASPDFWKNPPLSPSHVFGSQKQWNNLQAAMNLLAEAGDNSNYQALQQCAANATEKEKKGWELYCEELAKEKESLESAQRTAQAGRAVDSVLNFAELILSLSCLAFSAWAAWLAAGAFPFFRLLVFCVRFFEVLGILMCISLINLPIGLVIVLVCKAWTFATYKGDWRAAYESQQYQLFPAHSLPGKQSRGV